MYTNNHRTSPFLWERLCSSFSIIILVALTLFSTTSDGHLSPPPREFPRSPAPSNATLSSNTIKVYIVYSFVEGPSPDSENEKIRLHLNMVVAPADVREYGGSYTGVEFWRVNMNDNQFRAFTAAIPNAQILENTQLLYHIDLQSESQNASDSNLFPSESLDEIKLGPSLGAGTIYQRDAPPDLKVVSWAPDVPLGKSKSYAYNPENGEGAIIYIIENGIDGRNREFAWPPQEWLYAPGVRRTETDDDPSSHGSCVASKATGAKNGVSKTTRLVVVKASLDIVDIAWAFQQITNTVAKQKRGRVVVLLPATTKNPWRSALLQDARFNRLYLRMQNLINLGVVVVVPSGDYAGRRHFVDTVPAVFAEPSSVLGRQPLPLIVVGSVDNRGISASWSQTSLTDMVWAPGVKVACTKRGWGFRPTRTGTSFSAGMVAGLAANFLGMKTPPFAVGGPDTSLNLMTYFQTSASWERVKRHKKVIWNRLDGSLVPLSNASIVPLNTFNDSTY